MVVIAKFLMRATEELVKMYPSALILKISSAYNGVTIEIAGKRTFKYLYEEDKIFELQNQ